MMNFPEFKTVTKFEWKDLHKMIGQIIHIEPTESDIAEGDYKAKTWFVTDKLTWYLLDERDA
jgi:hypothetical protein